jgi:hypothetical protein
MLTPKLKIFRKQAFLFLVFACNIAYVIFLIIKTAISYRSGVASISQDLADHKSLQVIAVVLLILFASTFSYVQGIYASQAVEVFENNYTELLLFYTYQPQFSQIFWVAQFVALFTVLIYPVDIYPNEHYQAALASALLVWGYQVEEFVKRIFLFYKLGRKHLSTARKVHIAETHGMYPFPEVWSTGVLITNFVFVVLLFVFFITYGGFVAWGPVDIEQTTPIAVLEFLFFAGLPLGLVFNLFEVHIS